MQFSSRADAYSQVFKCVAIQIVEAQRADAGSAGAEPAKLEDTFEPLLATLWRQAVPHGKDVSLVPANPKPRPGIQEFSPVCLNMPFGGPRGEKLQHLNRVVACIESGTGAFTGFRFCYDGGSSATYGDQSCTMSASSRRFCVEMSFVVCGRQGERITEIRADRYTRFGSEYILALHV